MNRFIRDVKEGFANKPFRLIWILLWIVPLYLTVIFLSVLIGIATLSWKEGVEYFWRII